MKIPPIDSFRGENRFLSNFFPSPITVRWVKYPTVEHAFQAQKTTNLLERRRIAALPTPGEAKKAGRRVVMRTDWMTARVKVMKGLLELKFRDPSLRAALLSTGKQPLIEGNTWHDNFWGQCVCPLCGTKTQYNVLGKLLTELRRKLRNVQC